MPPRTGAAARAAQARQEEQEPPFYRATANLDAPGQGHPVPGIYAFTPGDKVPPDLLAANPQWGDGVEIPDEFSGALPPPPSPPPPDDEAAGEPPANT